MKAIYKGVAVAALHLLIVGGVGGKFLYDRAHRPRVWVRTGSIDPALPVRGRYVALRLQVQAPWVEVGANSSNVWHSVTLAVENQTLVALESNDRTGMSIYSGPINVPNRPSPQTGGPVYLEESVLFFLPEHADFPGLKQDDELWAEVTVPRKGPPRPLRLAVKRGTEWQPLSYR